MKFEYISENLYYRVSTESKTIEPDIFLPIENEIFQHLTSNSNIPQWSSYDPLHSVPIIHQIEQVILSFLFYLIFLTLIIDCIF